MQDAQGIWYVRRVTRNMTHRLVDAIFQADLLGNGENPNPYIHTSTWIGLHYLEVSCKTPSWLCVRTPLLLEIISSEIHPRVCVFLMIVCGGTHYDVLYDVNLGQYEVQGQQFVTQTRPWWQVPDMLGTPSGPAGSRFRF